MQDRRTICTAQHSTAQHSTAQHSTSCSTRLILRRWLEFTKWPAMAHTNLALRHGLALAKCSAQAQHSR